MPRITCGLFLFVLLLGTTGCQTIQKGAVGAATGMQNDVQNLADPSKNGWDALVRADGWMRQNVW